MNILQPPARFALLCLALLALGESALAALQARALAGARQRSAPAHTAPATAAGSTPDAGGFTALAAAAELVDATTSAGPTGLPPTRIPGTLPPAISAALRDPKFVAELSSLARLRLDWSYGALFKKLHLSAEDEQKLRDLMISRQLTTTDTGQSARALRIVPPREITKSINDEEREYDDLIHDLLGDANFATYRDYESTLRLRRRLMEFQESLSYTPTPLSDDQLEQLVDTFYQAHGRRALGHPYGMPITNIVGLTRAVSMNRFPDGVDAASNILSPPQMDALRRLDTRLNREVTAKSANR